MKDTSIQRRVVRQRIAARSSNLFSHNYIQIYLCQKKSKFYLFNPLLFGIYSLFLQSKIGLILSFVIDY